MYGTITQWLTKMHWKRTPKDLSGNGQIISNLINVNNYEFIISN